MSNLETQATQDYLKVIYELCERHERASTGRIAQELQVTPASVTGMLKKLAASEPPLLNYKKHQGVVLTADGEKRALQIIRRHRLLECFLQETLGYRWDEVHAEAEQLEHAISGALGSKIAALLQEPERDPHGSPIPTADLRLPEDGAVALGEIAPGQRVRVQRVSDRDAQLLRYLANVGLTPETELQILPPPPFSDHVRIQLKTAAKPITVSAYVAAEVFVTLLHETGEGVKPAVSVHEKT